MAIAERQRIEDDFEGEEDYEDNGESGTEADDSDDDSEEDPSYDILEETRSGFSKLSIKKSKSRIQKGIDLDSEGELDDVDTKVPELNDKDKKSFEEVEKIILQGAQLEKLKVEQCKIYLRKHGLRLTGNKDVLIGRIREHLEIIGDDGEKKYPKASFVLNCKGDACTGDVVMFEQNVYEMYNIASRSATGPPCGTRIVAGRIVKESYGAAKQQHTFTIEVLWSKGTKPLPPLHPLLIKGRNLYRLKTMRQSWTDEEKRRKVLLEKHSRGSLARSNREARIQEKELRKKIPKGQSMISLMRKEVGIIHEQNRQSHLPTKSSVSQPPPCVQHQQLQHPLETTTLQEQNALCPQHKPAIPRTTLLTEISKQNKNTLPQPNQIKSWNYNTRAENTLAPQYLTEYQNLNTTKQWRNDISEVQKKSNGFPVAGRQPRTESHSNANGTSSSSERFHYRQPLTSLNSYSPRRPENHHSFAKERISHCESHPNANGLVGGKNYHQRQPWTSLDAYSHRSPPRQGYMKRQLCRFYVQGRCYYGDNCKYLHN